MGAKQTENNVMNVIAVRKKALTHISFIGADYKMYCDH